MKSKTFRSLVDAALNATPIKELLGVVGAVVLERRARAAGNTHWYYCPDKAHLPALAELLHPASAVSFYFDNRIKSGTYSTELRLNAEKIIAESGEVIIGVLGEDQIQINVEIITGFNELREFTSNIPSTSRVFYGVFPSRDNDGVHAVTVILPDIDGTIRPHPH